MDMKCTSRCEDVLKPLHTLFETTCIEVFESLQCTIKKVDKAERILAVPCAYINAASDEIKMTLLLRGPISILKKTYPIQEKTETINPAELDDWISELSNRFMGSLKNKLIPYEHRLLLETPIKQFGVNVDNFLPETYQSFVLHFEIGHEVFECSLYTHVLTDNIQFIYRELKDISDTDDGELEMF